MTDEMPQIMTEEEAEKKVSIMKAAREVADSVDELKKQLENKGWSQAEMAALTLFNTLLMTSFSEQYKDTAGDRKKKIEEFKDRLEKKILERLTTNGFAKGHDGREIATTCVKMLIDGKDENQVGAVWEDFYGEGTKGVLFSAVVKSRNELDAEIEKEQDERDRQKGGGSGG